MAESFDFSLVSPEKELISSQVESVVIPGTDGDFMVLKGHAPVLSSIRPGILEINDGENSHEYFIRSGIADTTPDGLIILAEYAISRSELSSVKILSQIKNLEEDVADASDDEKRRQAQEELDHLKEIEKAIS